MEADEVWIRWAWGWRVDIFSTLGHVVDGLTDSNIVQKLLLSGESPKHIVMLLPLQVGCSKFESKIRYKKWCYFGAAKLLIFNTLIYEIVL